MSWFTEPPRGGTGAAAGGGRAWLPGALPAPGGPWRSADAAAPAPPLTFGEGEVARVAAAAALKAERDALAALAADPELLRSRAVERLAAALADAARRRAEEDGATLRQVVALATALAGLASPGAGGTPGLAAKVESMLAELPAGVGARLALSPADADRLRGLLPELARRAGLTDRLALEPDPRLPEGAARLLWPGGWTEHDPAELARRLAATLAPHLATADADADADARRPNHGTNDEHD